MEKIKSKMSDVNINITLTLTEDEARFLILMTKWGSEPYLKWFKTHLGQSDIRPLEGSVKSLFETIRAELPPHLRHIDEVRKLMYELKNKNKPNIFHP